MRRLYVPLTQEDMDALKTISARERRQPPMQASVLLSEAIRANAASDGDPRWADAQSTPAPSEDAETDGPSAEE